MLFPFRKRSKATFEGVPSEQDGRGTGVLRELGGVQREAQKSNRSSIEGSRPSY